MYYCPNCKKKLPRGAMLLRDGALICPNCRKFFGYCDTKTHKTYRYNPEAKHQPKKKNAWAIPALVFAFLLPPYGIALGVAGLKRCKACYGSGRKICAAAIAIASVWMIALVAAYVVLEFLIK